MLIVVNPRIDPEASVTGWLKHNTRLVAGQLLWGMALLMLAWLGQPRRFDADRWYSLTAAEGLPMYVEYDSAEACNAASAVPIPSCVEGRDLLP